MWRVVNCHAPSRPLFMNNTHEKIPHSQGCVFSKVVTNFFYFCEFISDCILSPNRKFFNDLYI